MSDALQLHVAGTDEQLTVTPQRLVVAGYTGRDEAAVKAHIDELAHIGVPPPPTVPAFYDLDPALLTTAAVVEVDGAETSGEVEPVLVRHAGRFHLAVGSDHTDRRLEREDIPRSKAACPKPLSRIVVALPEDLSEIRWDDIAAQSSVDDTPYQRGTLAALRTPADLLPRLTAVLGEIDGDLVVFGGTFPLLTGEFVHGTRWRLEMTLPDGTTLSHTYETKQRSA
ncbi:DUF2848 family protein [Pseudonocardia acidicola]|uniref:DUF2848 family protein n=1 Tax=Pseudonocardia acidicola TaxID=2724939 RepID=A0ABX1SME5_9PSEU|nr:DUF2848 family protein [Pseudonocardia acidicola]NMI01450.1 DUF2848 family protein [Pseudonocardia acidicola]